MNKNDKRTTLADIERQGLLELTKEELIDLYYKTLDDKQFVINRHNYLKDKLEIQKEINRKLKSLK